MYKRAKRHVSLSVVCQGRPSYGGQNAMLHRNLKGEGGVKNPGSTNKYTKFGQLIIRKIIKILPPDVTL